MCFFSIVISSYNAEQYIQRTLDSIFNQKFNDYEIVFVNNGSDDNTNSVVRKIIDTHKEISIKYIDLPINIGISGGRNAGIEHSSGKYICFLDADDYWYPDKLSTVFNYIHKESHTKIVLYHWEDHISKEMKKSVHYREVDNSNAFSDLLLKGDCLSTSAVTVDAELIKRIGGFNNKYTLGQEDYDCWIRLAQAGGYFVLIKECLGVFNISDTSVSSKLELHLKGIIQLLEDYSKDLKAKGTKYSFSLSKKILLVRSRYYTSYGRRISTQDKNKANELYFKSIKNNPLYMKAYAGLILNIF